MRKANFFLPSMPFLPTNGKRGEGRWSAGELVSHLCAIESAILSRTDKLLLKPPRSVPFLKRFHVPMMIVEARIIRRNAPVPLEPQMIRE